MENIKSLLGTNNLAVQITRVGLEAAPIVQSIFVRSPSYFKNVDNSEVKSHFAQREMTDTPKKQSPGYEKHFCIIEIGHKPIGVVDFHRNHPHEGTTYIGLLLILDEIHRQGVGRKVFQATEQYAIATLNTHTLRLGVSEQNNVEGYWSKMGFRRNGQTYEWKGENQSAQVFEMEKKLIL